MDDYLPKLFNGLKIGIEKFLNLNGSSYLIFFGNKNSDLDTLKKAYANLEFYFLNQTHSNIILPRSEKTQPEKTKEGDGHYSNKSNKALCIKTADCFPVFIISSNEFFAIHAGWKGVESKIILKARDISPLSDQSYAVAGPHIQQQNFEIDKDVFQKLLLGNEKIKGLYYEENNKFYLNLNLIVEKQLHELGIPKDNIHISLEDTYESELLNSYRENKNCGRNISFIAKIQ